MTIQPRYMSSGSGVPAASGSSSSGALHDQLALTFRQAWSDFYSSRRMDGTLHTIVRESIDNAKAGRKSTVDRLRKASMVPRDRQRSPTMANSVLESSMTPVPSYTFCQPLAALLWTQEERELQFLPVLPESSRAPFDAADYKRFFASSAWERADRDPDLQVILVETLRRFKEARGGGPLDARAIDDTKVLPLTYDELAGLREGRDLPPFCSTSDPNAQWFDSDNEDVANVMGSDDDDDDDDQLETKAQTAKLDQWELFCPNAACRSYGCNLHIRDGRDHIWPLPPAAEQSLQTKSPTSSRNNLRESRTTPAKSRVATLPPASSPVPIFNVECETAASINLCAHAGPCTVLNPDCLCAKSSMHCERTCLCSPACPRRHPGCDCRSRSGKACKKETCKCYLENRECDPDVCGKCGADQLACGNVPIQAGLVGRYPVRVGLSEIDGYGLFAGDKVIPKDAPILEYVGEMIDHLEAKKRVLFYEALGRNYLCDLNEAMCLDGFARGNEARYLNCAEPGRPANVYARNSHVTGNHRIVLLAQRIIQPHEELVFDYGEHFGKPSKEEKESSRRKAKKRRIKS